MLRKGVRDAGFAVLAFKLSSIWKDARYDLRAEARNKGLAVLYDQLGLAEYEAMEGFKRLPIPISNISQMG